MVWEGYSLGGGGFPRPNRYRRRSTDTVYQRPSANRAGDKEKGCCWQEESVTAVPGVTPIGVFGDAAPPGEKKICGKPVICS